MTNELTAFEFSGLKVTAGEIEFKDYKRLKESAVKLSEHLKTVEVTEDNVKTSKKLVSEVRKQVDQLEESRKQAKNWILEPYRELETKIKDITSVVKDSENVIRNQIRQLEELEREEKKQEIENIFNKRIQQYEFSNLFEPSNFITPKHLNKSTSMNKVEQEMVEWLETIDKGIQVIKSLEHSDEILAEYANCQDLTTAINIVNERYKKLEETEKVLKDISTTEETYTFKVFNSKDMKLIEMLMNENNIKFEKVGK